MLIAFIVLLLSGIVYSQPRGRASYTVDRDCGWNKADGINYTAKEPAGFNETHNVYRAETSSVGTCPPVWHRGLITRGGNQEDKVDESFWNWMNEKKIHFEPREPSITVNIKGNLRG